MTEAFEGTADDKSSQFVKSIREAPLAFSVCLYFSDLWAQVQGTGIQDRVVGSRSQSHTRMSARPFSAKRPPQPQADMVGELEYGRESLPSQPVKAGQPVIVPVWSVEPCRPRSSSAWLKCCGGAVMSGGSLRFSNPQGYLTLTVCWAFIPARMSLEAGSTLWFLKQIQAYYLFPSWEQPAPYHRDQVLVAVFSAVSPATGTAPGLCAVNSNDTASNRQ